MPLVRIDMIKGKSKEYRKTVLECVHNSLEEALGIPGWDRFQRITEIDRDNFEADGKTDDFMIIELTIFPGRSREQKKRATELITKSLGEKLSIAPADIFIIINEPPLENWGLGGRQMGE